MFYIETSCRGPVLCSDSHFCLGLDEAGGLAWTNDGRKALAFPSKEAAEEFCSTHKLSLDADSMGYEHRCVIVEEIRLPEVQDIAAKYGTLLHDNELFIAWGKEDYRVQIVRNTDIEQSPSPYKVHQQYEYVVGARLVQSAHGSKASKTIIEEIHNPSYKQLDEFVAKCVQEHKG